MNLDDVRIFTKVVEAGSFTKAAALLGMPKSTVSRRVSELEEALGVRLVQRTTRKLHLTDSGQIYFNQTSRVLGELEVAEVTLSEMQAEPRGLLRITTPNDLTGSMSDFIGQFQDRYPLVDLIVLETGRRVDLVAEGYDLAIRAGNLNDSSLVFKLLHRSYMSLFASPDYLARSGPIETPEQLSEHHCLIFGTEGLETTWQLHGPDGLVDVPVRGRLACSDFSLIRHSAVRGRGIVFMPHFGAHSLVADQELVHLLPQYRSAESNLYAVYPSARHLSPKVRAFIDFSSQWFSSTCSNCQS